MKNQKAAVEIELKKGEDEQITPDRIKGVKVEIGGRMIPLIYTMRVQLGVEREMETDFYTLQDTINKSKRCTKETIEIIRLMGNEGLRREGKEPDLTTEWLTDNMKPTQMLNYRIAVMGALIEGWYMETDNGEDEEKDLVLDEIRKKNGNTN